MTVDSSRVLIGAPDQLSTGAIQSAPLGTAVPTDARAALNEAFTGSGYVGEDGITVTPEYSTADIKDWSGATVRKVLESFSGTIAWSHIQFDKASLENAFGAENVVETAATSTTGTQLAVKIGARLPAAKSWAFKMKDGANLVRIVVPNGQVTSVGELAFNVTSAIPLPVELACYPDEDGNSFYIYTDDGVFSA